MRMKKQIKRIFSMAAGLVVLGTSVLPAQAGLSELVTDSASYEKEINNALWKNRDEDIVLKNGKIVFPNNSTETTSLITKTAAKKSEYLDVLVKAKGTLEFQKLPKGEQFIFAMGLGSVESFSAEKGNLEIQFTNDGGIKATVKAYAEEGDGTVLGKDISCGDLKQRIQVEAQISNDQKLTLKMNGKEVVKKEIPVTGEGRVGFLQSGSCGVLLSDVEVVAYRYDRPENVNSTEDFEKGTINTNVWSSKMPFPCYTYLPSGTNIVEEDGNYVFQFQNSGGAYLGTKYQYSNFELTFDVPYLQRKHVQDKEGNILTPKCDNFAVCIGAETSECSATEYTNAYDLIIFSGSSTVTSWNTKQFADASAAGYPYFSADCEKGFSVKVEVIDAVVTVSMKWLDETKYTEVFKYQVKRENPLGYVQIWTTAAVANLSVDNVRIVNKDKDPNLTEVDFKSGKIEKPADFAYEPVVQKEKPLEKESGFSWYWIPAGTAGICLLVVILTALTRKKKPVRKEGKSHEN